MDVQVDLNYSQLFSEFVGTQVEDPLATWEALLAEQPETFGDLGDLGTDIEAQIDIFQEQEAEAPTTNSDEADKLLASYSAAFDAQAEQLFQASHPIAGPSDWTNSGYPSELTPAAEDNSFEDILGLFTSDVKRTVSPEGDVPTDALTTSAAKASAGPSLSSLFTPPPQSPVASEARAYPSFPSTDDLFCDGSFDEPGIPALGDFFEAPEETTAPAPQPHANASHVPSPQPQGTPQGTTHTISFPQGWNADADPEPRSPPHHPMFPVVPMVPSQGSPLRRLDQNRSNPQVQLSLPGHSVQRATTSNQQQQPQAMHFPERHPLPSTSFLQPQQLAGVPSPSRSHSAPPPVVERQQVQSRAGPSVDWRATRPLPRVAMPAAAAANYARAQTLKLQSSSQGTSRSVRGTAAPPSKAEGRNRKTTVEAAGMAASSSAPPARQTSAPAAFVDPGPGQRKADKSKKVTLADPLNPVVEARLKTLGVEMRYPMICRVPTKCGTDICGAHIPNRSRMLKHLTTKQHTREETFYRCPLCKTRLEAGFDMEVHCEKAHPKLDRGERPAPEIVIQEIAGEFEWMPAPTQRP